MTTQAAQQRLTANQELQLISEESLALMGMTREDILLSEAEANILSDEDNALFVNFESGYEF